MNRNSFFKILLIVSGLLLCISCSSSKLILNENYFNSKLEPGKLVVAIDGRHVIRYSGNVEPEFGPGDPDSLIWNYFQNSLIKDIKNYTKFKNVSIDTCIAKAYYDNKIVKTSQRAVTMKIPSDGAEFTCKETVPDYVLLLSDVFIGTVMESHYNAPVMGANGVMGGGTSQSKKLIYDALVILWDLKAKRNIEYGIVKVNASGFFPVITMSEWENVSKAFVRKLFPDILLTNE